MLLTPFLWIFVNLIKKSLTICLWRNWKRVMIYGRKQKHLESNKEYDYIACLYPEGNLRADKCVFFNNEDIAEIIHRGFYG